jgi:hypothetical protein
MKHAALALAVSALALPPTASAETFTDPSGDNCGVFGSLTLCDDDATSVSQESPSPGTIRLTFTYAGPPWTTSYLPRVAIHTASQDRAEPDFLAAYYHVGGGSYAWQVRRWQLNNGGEVTGAVDATTAGTSMTLTFPAAAIGSPAQYRWWAAGGAVAEEPQDCPEQLPGSGFFTHVLGGAHGGAPPGSGDTPRAGRTAEQLRGSLRSAARTGGSRTGRAGALLGAGGFSVPLSGLDRGKVTAALGSASQVLAKGQVKLGASGRATLRVRLTAAGRRKLRRARRTLHARLTLNYRRSTGGPPIRVARKLRIAPSPSR